MNINVITLL